MLSIAPALLRVLKVKIATTLLDIRSAGGSILPGFALWLLLLGSVYASPLPQPRLAGQLDIELATGSLHGDMCLSNLPAGATVHFLLNMGLNIESVRAQDGTQISYDGYYDQKGVGQGAEYTVDLPHSSSEFCVRYVGQFPVYGKIRNSFDFKGMIAFNGETLRATEQSNWYPILFDEKTNTTFSAVPYNLRIRCATCSAIYVNGDRVQRTSDGQFSSTMPRPLFLFAGKFTFTEIDNTTFVNGTVSAEDATVIAGAVADIKRFYEQFVGIPESDTPVFLTFESVDRNRRVGSNTLTFTTWPTLAFDGKISFDVLLETTNGKRSLGVVPWHTLAHEMAHYYFGTLLVAHGTYEWFYTESTAEYMALKAMQKLLDQDTLDRWLAKVHKSVVSGPAPTPLNKISTTETPASDRYDYWPLLLFSLDKRVGGPVMGRAFSSILKSQPDVSLDYAFLRRAVLNAGASESDWNRFEQRCIDPPPAQSCLGDLDFAGGLK
jgi:hypothetical protein